MKHRRHVVLVLAGAAAALAVVGMFRGVDAERPATQGVQLVYAMDVPAAVDPRTALEKAVEVIRERVDEKGAYGPGSSTWVGIRGDRVVVEIVGLDPELVGPIGEIIGRSARLELQLVAHGSDISKRLFARASSDPAAQVSGIRGDVESWSGPGGGTATDFYVLAADGEERVTEAEAAKLGCRAVDVGGMRRCRVSGEWLLERFLRDSVAADPSLQPPAPQRFAHELVEGDDPGRMFWRTYLLEGTVHLDGTSVADASLTFDPQTTRPLVQLTLDAAGARTMEELTRNNVGRKLAIVLDGRVKSAPVIESAIPGGRVQITMGGGSHDEQEAEAQDLIAVLKTGSLPAPLLEVSRRQVGFPASTFLSGAWPYFVATGAVALALAIFWVLTRPKSAPALGA